MADWERVRRELEAAGYSGFEFESTLLTIFPHEGEGYWSNREDSLLSFGGVASKWYLDTLDSVCFTGSSG